MILTKLELENFVNFSYEECLLDGFGRFIDKVELRFTKKRRILPDKEYKRIITFKRQDMGPDPDRQGYNIHKAHNGLSELINQLDAIVKDQWVQISKEDYEFFEELYPERFV